MKNILILLLICLSTTCFAKDTFFAKSEIKRKLGVQYFWIYQVTETNQHKMIFHCLFKDNETQIWIETDSDLSDCKKRKES
ncbi:hypothetical protein NB501_03085 [Vibrio alginolyticus]|uniref:hypothetical protein n=1 Tax=Vibrio alginolyticus TaxID=663 RepID=UPI00215C51DD|nr:hypothetical protein [Vibrio alginolyticus]MCR9574427.1 hypothetical protein [Vibrio alginolyticus]